MGMAMQNAVCHGRLPMKEGHTAPSTKQVRVSQSRADLCISLARLYRSRPSAAARHESCAQCVGGDDGGHIFAGSKEGRS